MYGHFLGLQFIPLHVLHRQTQRRSRTGNLILTLLRLGHCMQRIFGAALENELMDVYASTRMRMNGRNCTHLKTPLRSIPALDTLRVSLSRIILWCTWVCKRVP